MTSDIRCREVDELLAGYAADALDGHEHHVVAIHLAECRNHDSEMRSLRQDLANIAEALEPEQPTERLRASLLAAFDRELASDSDTEVVAPQPLRLRLTAGLGFALAAAMLVVAIGLGAWGLSRGSDSEILVRSAAGESGTLQFTYIEGQELVVLDVELEAPPADRVYQVWQLEGEETRSLGVLTTHSGQLVLQADLSQASALALSVEPSGGSVTPTTNPVLVAALAN